MAEDHWVGEDVVADTAALPARQSVSVKSSLE